MTMVFPSTWTYTVQTCPFSEGKPRGCFDICTKGNYLHQATHLK